MLDTVAFVQECTCAERVVVLRVRTVGPEIASATAYVLVAAAADKEIAGVGLVSADVRRATWGGRLPPGIERQRAREEALEDARVVAIDDDGLYIDQDGSPRVVRLHGGRVVVTDAAPPPSATPFVALALAANGDPIRSRFEARGQALLDSVARDALEGHRGEVRRILDQATVRVRRRRTAIEGDLAKIGQADQIAAQAQWLVAEAARVPRGATKLVVTDWSTGEAVPIEVPLDPAKSAKDQVAGMFKRAKRLRLGGQIAEERLARTAVQAAAIARAIEAVPEARSLPDLRQILREAKRAAPRDVAFTETGGGGAATPTKRGRQGPRVPYRAFVARSGRRLLVGKGAADNDALTFHVGRPHDLWLHAKDRTGAHVIVVLDKGQTCPAEDLVDGAHLAAHFSEAREETVIDVQYTDRRYLRKPRRSPAGFVVVDREKVLVLRVEAEILRGLLEREEV